MRGGQQSDALRRLVVFVIALAIPGTIITPAWYYAVELPAQAKPAGTGPPCYRSRTIRVIPPSGPEKNRIPFLEKSS